VPKTSLQNIVFMASMGGIQLRLAETEIAYGYDDAIPTAVAQAFITALQQTTRRGLLRGYQSVEDSASVVRGRWNITRQLAMSPGIPLPIEIDFDDYTEDIDENRILASALQVLARIEGLESVLTDSIGRFRVFFSEVQSLPRGVPLPNLRLNRLNQHYAVPLRLARVILEAVSWTHRDGAVVGGTFLVDMAAVFESYIANRLQSVLADHGLDVTAQDQHWWLDAERSVSLRPDIVISHGGTPLTVADTKYKVLGDGQGSIPNGDIYQAVAYALALNVRSAHLPGTSSGAWSIYQQRAFAFTFMRSRSGALLNRWKPASPTSLTDFRLVWRLRRDDARVAPIVDMSAPRNLFSSPKWGSRVGLQAGSLDAGGAND
jgi:5-methylcytosine-specific restriction enzyme subunit McrC